MTYKICANILFMLLVRLLSVVACKYLSFRGVKIIPGFSAGWGVGTPNPCAIQKISCLVSENFVQI